jgi:hypothetical protein
LTEEYVLDNINKMIACLRDANVTIRWLMLHTNTTNKRLVELLHLGDQNLAIIHLLLNTAQLEYVLKQHLSSLLANKERRWDYYKKQSHDRMLELCRIVFAATFIRSRILFGTASIDARHKEFKSSSMVCDDCATNQQLEFRRCHICRSKIGSTHASVGRSSRVSSGSLISAILFISAGIEFADSSVFDRHAWIFEPYGSTA